MTFRLLKHLIRDVYIYNDEKSCKVLERLDFEQKISQESILLGKANSFT